MDVPAGVTSLTYDGNGNMINDSNWLYLYNEDNRLKTVTTQAGVLKEQYLYDHVGNRRVKLSVISDSLNKTTYYLGEDWLREEYTNGTIEDTLFVHANNELLARMDSAGARFFYHPDHLGSTVVVSRQDGSLEERISYKPFGEPRQVSDEVYQFTSQEYSTELGIYDYGDDEVSGFFDDCKGSIKRPVGEIDLEGGDDLCRQQTRKEGRSRIKGAKTQKTQTT